YSSTEWQRSSVTRRSPKRTRLGSPSSGSVMRSSRSPCGRWRTAFAYRAVAIARPRRRGPSSIRAVSTAASGCRSHSTISLGTALHQQRVPSDARRGEQLPVERERREREDRVDRCERGGDRDDPERGEQRHTGIGKDITDRETTDEPRDLPAPRERTLRPIAP